MRIGQKVRVRERSDVVIGEIATGPNRYFVLERLAERREIYRVFDPTAGPGGDFRALHVLPAGKATEQRLEVLKRVSDGNSNFPTIVDFHREPERVIVVLAWIWGTPLQEKLRAARAGDRRQRLSAGEATKRIRGLAHGISHFHHRANSVHGDVKPANIVLARDSNRQFVLIDFGSAWPTERTMERQEGDGISLPYCAPELLGETPFADFRSDIFSLCVVWYELLTHQIPYGVGGAAGLPENRDEFAGKLVAASKLSLDRGKLPAAAWTKIDAALRRGLALEANRRFSDKSEWLNALDDIQHELRTTRRLGLWNQLLLAALDKIGGKHSEPD
ncbi:MAG: protein kinase [Planctomycetaceae bacterium]|nr:protein kinase [Planctomycetaceae bacterium]